MKTKIDNDWDVRGICCKNGTMSPPAGEKITIPDSQRCIPSMPESSGVPINTELALRFIHRFNRFYAVGQRLTSVPVHPRPAFAAAIAPVVAPRIDGHLVPARFEDEFLTDDELELTEDEEKSISYEMEKVSTKGPDAVKRHYKHALVKLKRVVDLSHGMTFDRDLILKILSQSGCEGIRLYMCARKRLHVSLVVVGVDGKGCDHRQKPREIKKYRAFTGRLGDDPTIPDNSLLGEYSTPPPPKRGVSSDPRFALSYMAEKLRP